MYASARSNESLGSSGDLHAANGYGIRQLEHFRRMPLVAFYHPRRGAIYASVASHNPAALSAIASNTGWMSVGELAIMPRISLVAVCCSRRIRLQFLETAAHFRWRSLPGRRRFRAA